MQGLHAVLVAHVAGVPCDGDRLEYAGGDRGAEVVQKEEPLGRLVEPECVPAGLEELLDALPLLVELVDGATRQVAAVGAYGEGARLGALGQLGGDVFGLKGGELGVGEPAAAARPALELGCALRFPRVVCTLQARLSPVTLSI